VFVQVVTYSSHSILQRPTDCYKIEDGKMLDILTKTYSAGMRANGTSTWPPSQHREHLVDSAQPAAIYLTEVIRTGLQQLLEHHAAVTVVRQWQLR